MAQSSRLHISLLNFGFKLAFWYVDPAQSSTANPTVQPKINTLICTSIKIDPQWSKEFDLILI